MSGVMLIVSICLILISIVILRFTIHFTLSEEFREIGVMKAIGIRNQNIQNSFYMVALPAFPIPDGINRRKFFHLARTEIAEQDNKSYDCSCT